MDIDTDRVQTFSQPCDFGDWLTAHHAVETQLWIKIYKKSSGIRSITWSEAVVEALVWGWIDGLKKANDDTSWYQRFTPRRPKSGWSKINRVHAEKLISDGRMQTPGLMAVDAAKADGRWDAAYAGSANMVFPAAFLAAIAENPKAKETFDSLSRANLFSIYHRLQTAKKEATRQSITKRAIAALSRGKTFP